MGIQKQNKSSNNNNYYQKKPQTTKLEMSYYITRLSPELTMTIVGETFSYSKNFGMYLLLLLLTSGYTLY